MPDYLLIFRKTPDDEKAADPVGQDKRHFPVSQWQQWASPVWMDIDQTDVLNVAAGEGPKDEKHLCPLQLDLIERAIRLWSNPGDVVLSPFMGVGSEGLGRHGLRRRPVRRCSMSAPEIEGMARDMAREILDDDRDLFELDVDISDDGIHAYGDVIDVTHDGLDLLERWLQRAYEAGRRAP
jgi:hypothetical protein